MTWAAVALMGATLGVAAAPASAAAPTARTAAASCPTGWGSLDRTRFVGTADPVTGARAGRHDCYDRFVVDVPGASTAGLGYSVRYVDRFRQNGSGRALPVSGGAILEVRVMAPAHDDSGTATYPGTVGTPLPGVSLTGYSAFRDARFGGSFEGETQFGLGVRARLPFRVLVLDGRLVVDVAHGWNAAG